MKLRKRAVIAAVVIGLLGACVACVPKNNEAAPKPENVEREGVFVPVSVLKQINGGDNIEWAQEFPDQYLSYLSGIGELEPSSLPESDLGDLHSHAALRVSMDKYGAQNGQISYLERSGANCLSCKSSYFNELYDELGMEAYNVPYSEFAGKYAYWDCLACHEDKPGGPLRAKLVAGTTLLRNFPTALSERDLVCAQCHNSLTPYSRKAMSDQAIAEGKTLNDIDPYRYGVDADALLKAELEDGIKLAVDEESGVQTFYLPVSDIEILQGSVHQSMGLSCVDCHMPTMQNASGGNFTSHNASQGPLENTAALEKCLTCHKNQGIENVDQMRTWARDKQAALGMQVTALSEKLDELKSLIVNGAANGADDAVLDQARDGYLHARLYLDYVQGAVHTPGQKIAHNPEAMRDYIERGIRLTEEAIALF